MSVSHCVLFAAVVEARGAESALQLGPNISLPKFTTAALACSPSLLSAFGLRAACHLKTWREPH